MNKLNVCGIDNDCGANLLLGCMIASRSPHIGYFVSHIRPYLSNRNRVRPVGDIPRVRHGQL